MPTNQIRKRNEFHKIYGIDYIGPTTTPLVKGIIDALSLDKDSVVVEVGAGEGYFTLPIAKQLAKDNGEGLVFAFDYSLEMIKRLDESAFQSGVEDRVRAWPLTMLEDPGTLPINDSMVDRVLAMNFVQYLDDPVPMLREFARILKPGGVALIGDWSIVPPEIKDITSSRISASEKSVVTNHLPIRLGVYTDLEIEDYSWVLRIIKNNF